MSARRVISKLDFPYRAARPPAGVPPAPEAKNRGADYDTDWARKPAARAARRVITEVVMQPAMAALARPQRRGLDRIERLDGPVIFAANHHSHIDTPLLFTSIPPRWRKQLVVGAAADYFFTGAVKSAASALVIGAIPVERSKVGRRSARLAASLIEDGWSLLIFPEGAAAPTAGASPSWGAPATSPCAAAFRWCRCMWRAPTGSCPRAATCPRCRPPPSPSATPWCPPKRTTPGGSRLASRWRWPPWPTSAPPTGTRPAAEPTPAPPPASPAPISRPLPPWRRAWALGDRSSTPLPPPTRATPLRTPTTSRFAPDEVHRPGCGAHHAPVEQPPARVFAPDAGRQETAQPDTRLTISLEAEEARRRRPRTPLHPAWLLHGEPLRLPRGRPHPSSHLPATREWLRSPAPEWACRRDRQLLQGPRTNHRQHSSFSRPTPFCTFSLSGSERCYPEFRTAPSPFGVEERPFRDKAKLPVSP